MPVSCTSTLLQKQVKLMPMEISQILDLMGGGTLHVSCVFLQNLSTETINFYHKKVILSLKMHPQLASEESGSSMER